VGWQTSWSTATLVHREQKERLVAPRISVYIACSLDGFIASADGGLDWLEAIAGSGEDYGFEPFLAGVDAVAMGRGTWDTIAGVPDLPYGHRPLYVFTHRLADPRPGVTFWERSPRAALAEWADHGHRAVYLDGGRLVSAFLGEGLVDDLAVTVAPVLLGTGMPLFHPHGQVTDLALAGVRSWPSGMVQLRYRRRGAE
jgi:dihydrofolate reductase